MAFVYEVNGQKVEFDKEPTEADIDEAARALRPAAKSQQQRPVEGAGGAAFGVYRPQGRRPESQQDREAAKDMPLQTARGVVTGALGGPSDLLNLPGVLYSAVSGQPQPYQVPLGSESWNEMLPFKSDAPSAKLARLGGEVMAPFPTVKGLQTIPKAAGAVGDVVSGAVGTGTGYIARPGRTPRGYQQPSQRNPIGSTYTPPEEFAKFERGELPYGQMPEQRPISELPEGRLDRAAMMLSGGNIPNAGQGARAFGERLGETYRNPLTAAADIGSMFFTGGVPVLTALRGGLAGAQALADLRLANKGFTPELPKILDEYQTGVRPLPGVQPGPMPRDFMATGPVSPGGMAAPTPAAQAAMATTQRVAKTPAAPRAPVQPFTLPDVGTHYSMAEQGSTNFGDTFNKAVAARTQDLLKNARQTGQALPPETAEAQAIDEIKAWRRENVPAFQPKAEAAGPVAPTTTPEQALAEFNPPKVDEELLSDQRIWQRLQDKTKAGTPLVENEQTAVRRITNKYGKDPFQTGDLKGNSVFEAADEVADVADGFQVRAGMKQSAKAGITSKNGKIQIDEAVFNDAAKSMGMPEIDFKSMPDLKGMSVAEARKAVATEINRQYKAADAYGKTTRGPNQSTLVKQAEAERTAGMTPEQIAAEEQANLARLNKLGEYLKTGKLGTTTPTSTTPEVTGPVRPEGAVDTPKLTNAELLDLIKARSKQGKPPAGTNQLITQNLPSKMLYSSGKKGIQAIQNSPWLPKEDFDTAVFNRSIGFDKNNQFIAKTRTENGGSIIIAEDKKTASELVRMPDGTEIQTIKDLQNPGSYSFNVSKDGVEQAYTFDIPYGAHATSKNTPSEPMTLEIYDKPTPGGKRGQLLASWEADTDWMIVQKNKDGSYQTVPWYEIEQTTNHPLKEKLDGLRDTTGLDRHANNGFDDVKVSDFLDYWKKQIKELKESK